MSRRTIVRAFLACTALTGSGAAVGLAGTTPVAEIEPNNTIVDASHNFGNYIGWGSYIKVPVSGVVATAGDLDYFPVRSTPPQLKVSLSVPTGKDYDIQIVDWLGRVVASGHKGAGVSETVQFTQSSTNPAQYPLSVKVFSADGSSSASAGYVVTPG